MDAWISCNREKREKLGKYPEVKYSYLLGYFYQVGPTITPSELKAWQDLMGIELNGWEVSTLIYLSKAFNNQVQISRDENAFNPMLTRKEAEIQRQKQIFSKFKSRR